MSESLYLNFLPKAVFLHLEYDIPELLHFLSVLHVDLFGVSALLSLSQLVQ